MPVHPAIAEVVATFPPASPAPPDPAAVRAEDTAAPPEQRVPLHSVTDRRAGGVPVRVYAPTERATSAAIVYAHGGAFFSGSLDSHDQLCRELAVATGREVISVGFRLAPEAAFPAGLDDVSTVLRAIAADPSGWGWDGSGLALAGDSSGANMVASLTASSRPGGADGAARVDAQVLLYPSLDLDFSEAAGLRYPSRVENAQGYGLETAGLAPFNSFYLDSGADPQDPRVSPLLDPDPTGLPRTLVITAEYDPLRDEGELYAERLRDAGVPVRLVRWAGATHGFLQHFAWVPEMHTAFDAVAAFLDHSD